MPLKAQQAALPEVLLSEVPVLDAQGRKGLSQAVGRLRALIGRNLDRQRVQSMR